MEGEPARPSQLTGVLDLAVGCVVAELIDALAVRSEDFLLVQRAEADQAQRARAAHPAQEAAVPLDLGLLGRVAPCSRGLA